MKLTIQEIDGKIWQKEFLRKPMRSSLDANTMWPIMIRDRLWPVIYADKYLVYLSGNRCVIHKDPLIAVKLAYLKLHFELDVEVI